MSSPMSRRSISNMPDTASFKFKDLRRDGLLAREGE